MMKKISFIILVIAALVTACKKDFLEKKPLDAISDADVWKDPALVKGFVNDLYARLWDPLFDEWKVMHTAITDEGMYVRDKGTDVVVKGTLTPENLGTLSNFGNWANYYKGIRNCNLLLERIDEVPFTDASFKTRMIGEAYFMRAYYYFTMVSYWGGVPIVNKAFGLEDKEEVMVPRNTYEECVNAIVKDCDSAIKMLPAEFSGSDQGRATSYSAMALKSRMLLYAASDLFNQPGNNNALVGYVGGDRTTRWQAAKKAAKDILDKPGKHALYQPTDSAAANYARIFLDNFNPEIMFAKLHNKELKRTRHDLWNGPNGYHNWGGNVPIEGFVTGYQMRDGTAFNWNDPVMKLQPYKNRDPRFYASILYDGAKWGKRPDDAAKIEPEGIIQTGRYEKWNATTNKIDTFWGIDTKFSAIENWNSTTTGYYTRKFLNININAQFEGGDQPWVIFRLGEIYLNYAEACLALNEENDARIAINKIRTRAGMPAADVAVTGAALRDLYRYERKYELAFEGHRYFDVRRWLIADQVLAGPATGIDIYGKLNPDKTTYTFTYKIVQVATRSWNKKAYFSPVMVSEIQKNSKLLQNPNY